MARWKSNSDGSAYYDPNDDGPNQVDAAAIARAEAAQGKSSLTSTQTTQQTPQYLANPTTPTSNPYPPPTAGANYDANYWAPDRQAVLQQYGIPDTSGKTWNGSSWSVGGMVPGQGTPNYAVVGEPAYDPIGHPSPDVPSLDSSSSIPGQGGTTPGSTPPYVPPTPAQTPTPDATPSPTPNPLATTPARYGAMEGVDLGKLNDPTHTSPKYVAARILASGGSLADAARAIGATQLDATRMRLSTGEIIDTRRDEEGANALQWLVTFDPNAPATGDTGAGGTTGSTGAGGSNLFSTLMANQGLAGGQPGSNGVPGQNTPGSSTGNSAFYNPNAPLPFAQQGSDLWSILLGRAQQGMAVNARDPIVANQLNAANAAQERTNRQYLSRLAESSGPGANLRSEGRQLAEHSAQASGALQASLMQNELTARRTEIQNALAQMGSLLSDQQRNSLTEQLGYLDAAIRTQQLGTQNDQFYSDLNQNNNQYLNTLGFNTADRSAYWNAINSGLVNG